MKFIKTFKIFEENNITIKGSDIIAQNKGLSKSEDGSAFIKPNDMYVKKIIPLSSVNNKLNYNWYKKMGLDEDLYMIDALVNKIKSGVNLHPIVLDKNMKIQDGNHRFIAYKKLKYTEIEAYLQI